KPNVARTGPNWMFYIDTLTMSIKYQPVFTGNQINGNAGPKSSEDEVVDDAGKKSIEFPRKKNGVQDPAKEGDKNNQEKDLRDQEDALRKQYKQEFERLFGQGEAANTNRLNAHQLILLVLLLLLWIQEEKEHKGMSLKVCLDKTRMLMAIGCSLINKKDERGIVVRNKARLVAQGYTQEEGVDYVEVFTHVARIEAIRSIIGSLMYVIASKPDIMFDVCACARFQVTHKVSHLHAMKRIFRYLKGQPKLGLWYPKDLPFNLEAFSDSDYAGASLDKKSIIRGCQFLRKRLISWECKKQTVVANLITKAKYVAAANCCGQVLWILNQMLDYGFNFMNTKIYIDNEMMNLELKLVVAEVSTVEQKLVMNGCLDWNETTANDEIQAYTYYCQLKVNVAKHKLTTAVYTSCIEQFWATAKHLDGGVKFLMYPRFVQVFLDNQVEGMDRHNVIFVISSHTKKVFANMKREGKDFSGRVTPLFQSMMVQLPEDMGEGSKMPTDPHHTSIVTQPSSSQPQKKQKSKRKQRKEIKVSLPSSEIPNEEVTLRLKRLRKVGIARRVESSTKASLGNQEDASKQGRMIDSIDQDVKITLVNETQRRMNKEDMFGVNDLDGDEDVTAGENVEQIAKVAKKEVSIADPVSTAGEVVTTASVEIATAATTLQIFKDELTLAQTLIKIKADKPKVITTTATTVTAAGTRPKEKGIVMQEPSETPLPKPIDSSQKPSQAKDKGKKKMVKPEKPLKRKDQIMVDEDTQAMMDADCEPAARLQEEERGESSIEENSRLFIELVNKRKKHFARLRAEKIRKGGNKAVEGSENSKEGNSKRAGSNLEQEDAKRQRLEEENESVELKRCVEIIPKDTMFEHHVKDNIWKYQQGTVKVLNWKRFDSCGVYCVTTKNMVYYLLVNKIYPFTRNILNQMWNDVRLQVDYEVEMAYDLLRLIKRQINKGYVHE
nr:putative reverse transcriptase, RNA-dependent DNA polymerase [Tanacetum cinerariifolium]